MTSEWFRNPIYRRYWSNYDKSLRWYRKHWREWRRIAASLPDKAQKNQKTFEKPLEIEREQFEFEPTFELQVTEELIAFLEQSALHRKQLKLEREREELENGWQDDGQTLESSSLGPPKQRPGALDMEQTKHLYGADAAMIHGMETAMDLSFQRHCDLHHPKPWPNIPLQL